MPTMDVPILDWQSPTIEKQFMENPRTRDEVGMTSALTVKVWDFADAVLKSRFARALETGVARYPVHRSLRCAARLGLELLFDRIALDLGWSAQRLDSHSMILEGEGLFVTAYGGRKADYCSCFFGIWSDTPVRAAHVRESILDLIGSARVTDPMFTIEWNFLTSKGELESASIEELADDVLHDEAYPELSGGVTRFVERYLDSPETVLVLQGPPGTGKTRLIRAILGALSRRKGGAAQALYTGDKKALECDQMFVKFITGWDDAFVVEDADHLLKPRAEGNENLHRFLAIADGVVRSQGRKIIFSTNLPNVGDLDDALVRPGRCYARVNTRALSRTEAESLLTSLCEDSALLSLARQGLLDARSEKWPLAEVYKLLADARSQ